MADSNTTAAATATSTSTAAAQTPTPTPTRCFAQKAPEHGPPLFQHGNVVFQAHHVGWLAAGFFASVATVTSFWLINKHLQWYTNKREQRYIVRILFLVPIYALISLASYLFWDQGTPLILVRDAYESTVLTAFLYLLLMYLSPDPDEQKAIFLRVGLSRERERAAAAAARKTAGAERRRRRAAALEGKLGDGGGGVLPELEVGHDIDDGAAPRRQTRRAGILMPVAAAAAAAAAAVKAPGAERTRATPQPPPPVTRWMFPLCWVRWKPKDGLRFLWLMKWAVLQYCVVRPVTTFAAVVLDYLGLYCDASWNPRWGHAWITTVISISVSVAMYCLVQLYMPIKWHLAKHRPLLKLFAIKAVVFLTFWQATFLSALEKFGLIKDTRYMTAAEINIGFGALLETFEMMLFAFLHVKAYPYAPYRLPPASSLSSSGNGAAGGAPPPKRMPRLRALGHALDFRETWRELAAGAVWVWHALRGRERALDRAVWGAVHLERMGGKGRARPAGGAGGAGGAGADGGKGKGRGVAGKGVAGEKRAQRAGRRGRRAASGRTRDSRWWRHDQSESGSAPFGYATSSPYELPVDLERGDWSERHVRESSWRRRAYHELLQSASRADGPPASSHHAARPADDRGGRAATGGGGRVSSHSGRNPPASRASAAKVVTDYYDYGDPPPVSAIRMYRMGRPARAQLSAAPTVATVGHAQPDDGEQSGNDGQPDQGRSGHGQSDHEQSDHEQSDHEQSDSSQSIYSQSDPEQADAARAGPPSPRRPHERAMPVLSRLDSMLGRLFARTGSADASTDGQDELLLSDSDADADARRPSPARHGARSLDAGSGGADGAPVRCAPAQIGSQPRSVLVRPHDEGDAVLGSFLQRTEPAFVQAPVSPAGLAPNPERGSQASLPSLVPLNPLPAVADKAPRTCSVHQNETTQRPFRLFLARPISRDLGNEKAPNARQGAGDVPAAHADVSSIQDSMQLKRQPKAKKRRPPSSDRLARATQPRRSSGSARTSLPNAPSSPRRPAPRPRGLSLPSPTFIGMEVHPAGYSGYAQLPGRLAETHTSHIHSAFISGATQRGQ